jgi:hypothetical protein
MILSKTAYARARAYVERNGRPLEVARLRFQFDGAPAEEVAAELSKFQNPDGGFGNGLEPDLRTPYSSALAVVDAFQIMGETGNAPAFAGIAASAIQYLLNTFDAAKQRWVMIPPQAEDSPHAPWWSAAGMEQAFNGYSLNPTAEILGCLYDSLDTASNAASPQVPPQLLASLSEAILSRLTPLSEIGMHDFLCCKRLSESANLDPAFRAALVDQLMRLLDSAVGRDPAQWPGYSLRPLQVASRPQSIFYAPLKESIELNLDYEISNQGPDGAWSPNWDWGGMYPQEWEQARQEWAGVIIVEKLLALKRYGRIE